MNTQYPYLMTDQRPTKGRHYLLSLLMLWIGIAGFTPTTLYAQTGQALSFDGVNDFVQVPAGTYFSGSDLTIEVWVYPRSRSNYARIIDFGNGAYQNNVYLSLNTGTTGKPRFFIGGVGSSSETENPLFSTNQELPLNQWSHVAVTLSSKTATFYINGVASGQATFNTTPANVSRSTCYIGRSNWAGDAYADAIIDDMRIWNVARTATQIAENKDCELKGNETGLVAYYNFNQGTAGADNNGVTSLPDGTANKNAGTLNNFALSGTTSNWVAPGAATKCVNCNTYVTRTTANGLGSNVVNDVFAVGNTVYAATDNGLSISTDGGQTFVNRTTANGLPNNKVNSVFVAGNTIYAATVRGLGISVDGGQNFEQKILGAIINSVVVSGTVIHATISGGSPTSPAAGFMTYAVSRDGGVSFQYSTVAPNTKFIGMRISAVGNTIYMIIGGSGVPPTGLYVSTNGGQSFSFVSGSNSTGTARAVYAVGNNIYYGRMVSPNAGLMISTNGGQTFVTRTTANGLADSFVRSLYAIGSTVYAGTTLGLSISTDGGQTFINHTTANGLGSNNIMGVYAVGTTVYAATSAGLSVSNFRPQVIVPGGQPTVASEVTAAPNTSLTLRAADTNTGYSWSPGGATTKDLVVTTSGTYSVTATGNCPGTGSVVVNFLTAQPTNAVSVTTSPTGISRVTISIPVTASGIPVARLAAAGGFQAATAAAPIVKVTGPSGYTATIKARAPRAKSGGRLAAGATYTASVPSLTQPGTYTVSTYTNTRPRRLISVQTFTR